jgi:RNA-directed DNA polymerase
VPRLSPRLAAPPELLVAGLRDAKSASDLADLFEIRLSDLNYILYRGKARYAYRSFEIPKRTGGTRLIEAPHPTVKILQQKLLAILSELYEPTRSAHGYIRGRSIVSNARRHEGKRWVLNVDLKDFFPSINFGRVRGLFIQRYRLDASVATVLAQLCTRENHLPQGAPTSPIISNMICIGLDRELHSFVREQMSWYTRYSDDLTISSRLAEFPVSIAAPDPISGVLTLSPQFEEIVRSHGFKVNPAKIWLRPNNRRQRVTGITVNQTVNVPRRHVRRIRTMLHVYETLGRGEARRRTFRRNPPDSRYPGAPRPEVEQVIRGHIAYVGMVRGPEDPVYLALMQRFLALRRRRRSRPSSS